MITFKEQMNKEENSLCKIVKDSLLEVTLTEKELEDLVDQIYKYRPDVFYMINKYKQQIDNLDNENKELYDEIENLREEIDMLEEN